MGATACDFIAARRAGLAGIILTREGFGRATAAAVCGATSGFADSLTEAIVDSSDAGCRATGGSAISAAREGVVTVAPASGFRSASPQRIVAIAAPAPVVSNSNLTGLA